MEWLILVYDIYTIIKMLNYIIYICRVQRKKKSKSLGNLFGSNPTYISLLMLIITNGTAISVVKSLLL